MQIILTEKEYGELKASAERAKRIATDDFQWKYSKAIDKVFKDMKIKYPDDRYSMGVYDSILLFWDKVKQEIDKWSSFRYTISNDRRTIPHTVF